MKKIFLPVVAMFFAVIARAQSEHVFIIKSSTDSAVVAGATVTVKSNSKSFVADSTGVVRIDNLPSGKQTLIFSSAGFEEMKFDISQNTSAATVIYLTAEEEEEMEEVVLSSTRTSRTIKNTPTRVETIETEEIEEKINMRPANVAMLLHESTGIQVQQTSATSANAAIRLQGLDGKYTQLLKDGYPSFGNFAGGLSVLEIPPLDLKQVEIIKGPASTLYGGGAVAGVVNFISKTPNTKGNYDFILNQSNIGQTNIGAFLMKRNKKTGFSLLALYNKQKLYDVDEDGFTELPESNDFTVHPKLFLYPSEKMTISIGNSFTKADRRGGDVSVIKGNAVFPHIYFEDNATIRNTSTLDVMHAFSAEKKITVKSSFSFFKREIGLPFYLFKGRNNNFFTDVSYIRNMAKQTVIIGANFISDRFSEQSAAGFALRNFKTNTAGLYAQHTWDITENLKLESGLRTDLVSYNNQLYNKTEFIVLPRVSALYRFTDKLSSRIGAGLGYKSPTIFTEETETIQFRNILPLNNVRSERSYGGTADINYSTAISSDLSFSVNQMFFATVINHAADLRSDGFGSLFFINQNKAVVSRGFETNAKLIYKKDLKLFAGFTFTDAQANYFAGNKSLVLLPKNKLNLALVYEKERNFKLGLEGYFTDRQFLTNGLRTPSYWEFGAAAEKTFNKITFFINAENFTDTRQSNYMPVVNPPQNNPTFDEIWTHTEGFVWNGGIKLKL